MRIERIALHTVWLPIDGTGFRMSDGRLSAPTDPGLGTDLDTAQLGQADQVTQ